MQAPQTGKDHSRTVKEEANAVPVPRGCNLRRKPHAVPTGRQHNMQVRRMRTNADAVDTDLRRIAGAIALVVCCMAKRCVSAPNSPHATWTLEHVSSYMDSHTHRDKMQAAKQMMTSVGMGAYEHRCH